MASYLRIPFTVITLTVFITTLSMHFGNAQESTGSGQILTIGVPQEFRITAYYSPLPGQKKYLRGNYEAELRLNGQGIRGASGKDVHVGMLAAPKSYPFGTQIQFEGLGVGTVADRGGAIVHAGERGESYDRIDVWMGYGDEGLARALNWGTRVVTGTILGKSGQKNSIDFQGLKSEVAAVDEKAIVARRSSYVPGAASVAVPNKTATLALKVLTKEERLSDMGKGALGDDVKVLQRALLSLGYYKGTISGEYDPATISAVFTFQKDQQILDEETDHAAGYFGRGTRTALVKALAQRSSSTSASLVGSAKIPTDIPKPKEVVSTVSRKNDAATPKLSVSEFASEVIIPTKTEMTSSPESDYVVLPRVTSGKLDVLHKTTFKPFTPARSGAIVWK